MDTVSSTFAIVTQDDGCCLEDLWRDVIVTPDINSCQEALVAVTQGVEGCVESTVLRHSQEMNARSRQQSSCIFRKDSSSTFARHGHYYSCSASMQHTKALLVDICRTYTVPRHQSFYEVRENDARPPMHEFFAEILEGDRTSAEATSSTSTKAPSFKWEAEWGQSVRRSYSRRTKTVGKTEENMCCSYFPWPYHEGRECSRRYSICLPLGAHTVNQSCPSHIPSSKHSQLIISIESIAEDLGLIFLPLSPGARLLSNTVMLTHTWPIIRVESIAEDLESVLLVAHEDCLKKMRCHVVPEVRHNVPDTQTRERWLKL